MGRTGHFLFFTEDISSDTVILNDVETRHATGVLRSHTGDLLRITDGKGGLATCILDSIAGRNGRLTVVGREQIERKPPLVTLGIGLPERDAFESILSNSTAFGIDRILPIQMHYCQKRWWGTDWNKTAIRFHQIMITALKQSQGFFLPRLAPPCNLEDALSGCSGIRLAADPAGKGLSTFFTPGAIPQSITCFIGPPGGFDENELEMLEEQSVHLVKIALLRLRTELAAIALCAQITGLLL